MAKKILISYNFSQNEIQNAVAHLLASAPSSPVEGQFYYDTTAHAFFWRSNSAWINPIARANHTGTQAWNTLTGTPTTLAGYSISDAAPSSHVGSGGAAHANVVAGGAAGFMTGADKSKLDGVATGATANSTDATLLARANHTGTQLAATIIDFDSQVRSSRLDQMTAPSGSLSMNSQRITNVSDGVSASDAVTLQQLQNVQNGTDWKASVRVGTTANITQSGTQTIDGVALNVGDRVLSKNQNTGSQNGIHVVAAGAWSRALDATNGNLTPDSSVMIEEGTTLAGTQWRISTTGAITVGSTAITWTQFGASTTYTQGNGVTITGTVVAIDTSVVARKAAATIGDGSSTSIAVTHGLGTKDIIVSVRDASTDAAVECDWVSTSTTQATFTFASAPASNAYRVTILG